MTHLDRRSFLQTTIGAMSAGVLGSAALPQRALAGENAAGADNLRLAAFRYDVTPPMGHSMCGGWIQPAVAVDDPLEAVGFVLLGAGRPMVLCAVDWTGLLNEAHIAWRTALAEAVGTTIDRVAVQCIHPHNAPFACLEAQRIVEAQKTLPHIVDMEFFQRCLDAGKAAVAEALKHAVPVTHVAAGEAKVDRVASNRHIFGPDGRVISQRGSGSRNPEHQELPEGLIDPMLKTVAFYQGERKLAACHYYACHPMSYYGDGRVSADFCGLARKQRQTDEPECTHVYFNGCGGNIGAGKYNDGSKEMRPVLTARMVDAMLRSEAGLRPEPVRSIGWATHDILPPPRPELDEAAIMKQIEDPERPVVQRNRPSYIVAWLRRYRKQIPITLSALHVNRISVLHLPGESFVEYQLRAQAMGKGRFVACAAYGDGGPWYIPTAEAYPRGGYEPGVAWCDPQIDGLLTAGIASLLEQAPG
ncbi:MAG: hypothetical protein RBS80_23655 [Thermoguttaceae bacterium]|jgi:hypothetical protein|nr:hypothetical protein [Thermoguttaceae bacterium]